MQTDKEFLEELYASFQEIQKVNHPDSVAWISASKEMTVIAKKLVKLTEAK